MKKIITLLMIVMIHFFAVSHAQVIAGPYAFKISETYDPPSKQDAENIVSYGKDGIIQANSKGGKSFSFQKFSTDLKLEKENTVEMEGKIQGTIHFERLVGMKTKSYLFLRDVNKESKTEGITALEFNPSDLTLSSKAVPLFQSSGAVSGKGFNPYECILSEDRTKLLYRYTLAPKIKDDRVSKEIIGMQVVDENLNKLWGGEFEMPYTERVIKIMDFKLSDAGEAFLLIRVYHDDISHELNSNYHLEVLTLKKDTPPQVIQLKSNGYISAEGYLSEDPTHTILLITTFAKSVSTIVNGTHTDGICIGKITGNHYIPLENGLYEIGPSESTPGGFDDLKIRNVYHTPNGSIKVITEMYLFNVFYRTIEGRRERTVDITSKDIVIFSVDAKSRMEWVKRVQKYQWIDDEYAEMLSMSSISKGNEVHLFFLDKNEDANDAGTKGLMSLGVKAYIKAVTVDEKGNSTRYVLGKINPNATNFFITQFMNGNMNNLISNTKRRKNNQLFSIQVN